MKAKRTIKVLQDVIEELDGTCTFWGCEGHQSMRIKTMITCHVCASIIRLKREIKHLQQEVLDSKPNQQEEQK